jgi:hypothetical protein
MFTTGGVVAAAASADGLPHATVTTANATTRVDRNTCIWNVLD